MTRNEAIKILKSKMDGHTDTSYEWAETVRMAIKALEQELCEDAISREETLKTLMDEWTEYDSELIGWLFEKIDKLPSVTPQPKMGHWIKTIGENGVTSAIRCSGCGFEDNRYELFNYCPNCGRPMENHKE